MAKEPVIIIGLIIGLMSIIAAGLFFAKIDLAGRNGNMPQNKSSMPSEAKPVKNFLEKIAAPEPEENTTPDLRRSAPTNKNTNEGFEIGYCGKAIQQNYVAPPTYNLCEIGEVRGLSCVSKVRDDCQWCWTCGKGEGKKICCEKGN